MTKVSQDLSVRISNMSIISALAVVLIHINFKGSEGSFINYFQDLLDYHLYSFAVPFFFWASGFFIAGHAEEKGWVLPECVKRIRTLFIPYIIWIVLHLIFDTCISVMQNGAEGFTFYSFHSLCRYFGISYGAFPYAGSLWYLRVLMLFIPLAGVIAWFFFGTKKRTYGGLLLFLILWGGGRFANG